MPGDSCSSIGLAPLYAPITWALLLLLEGQGGCNQISVGETCLRPQHSSRAPSQTNTGF